MSTSLYWRPVPKETPPEHDLPYGLKRAIAERLWGHDGSLYGDKIVIDASYRQYFVGLADGGNGEIAEGALEVLKALDEHGAIEIWIGG
jgi:hypothetical protein